MTILIYNYGMPAPLSDPRLDTQRKINRIDKSKSEVGIHDTESEHRMSPEKITTEASVNLKKVNDAYQKTKNESRHQVFTSADIMSTGVITLDSEATLASAWLMFKNKRFRHFPVVDKNVRLIGIVSDRDILAVNAPDEKTTQYQLEQITVAQIMKSRVLTASEETPIEEICRVMFSHHVGAIPIVSHSHSVLGIITRSDILRTMIRHKPLQLWI